MPEYFKDSDWQLCAVVGGLDRVLSWAIVRLTYQKQKKPSYLCITSFIDQYSSNEDVLEENVLLKSITFPGDSKSWESPDEADIVSRLFIQILFR